MVPRPERKILGVGERDRSFAGHFELSDSIIGRRFAEDVVGRSRRAIAWTMGWEARDVRVVRMWEPYGIV